MAATSFSAEHAWLPEGFAADVAIRIDGGELVGVTRGEKGQRPLGRYVLPGIANLHSHAFQRAMAGLAERQSNTDDSFWTWREVMYAFAGRIGPDDLQGDRSAALRRDAQGGLHAGLRVPLPASPARWHAVRRSGRDVARADRSGATKPGIGLTLLPTLYMTGGFDGRPLSERQRRFGHDVDGYLRLLERLRHEESPRVRVGVALHSLRAVPEAGDARRARIRISRAPARSISMSPSRSAKCRIASRSAMRGRSNGCSITRRSMRAGASCMRRT